MELTLRMQTRGLWTMTVQTLDNVRPRGSLRRRMVVGLGLVASLILLAASFLLWQLNMLKDAIQDLREQNDQLALALDTAYQETYMLVVVQDKLAERIPSIFVKEVGAAVRALEARQDKLSSQLPLLPESDPMRSHIGEVVMSLRKVTNVAKGTIRHVEDGNWPAAESYAALLLERHSDVGWQLYQLVTLARNRHTQAEARASAAMARMVLGSAPLAMAALMIATAVVFVTVRSITLGVEQLSHSAHRLAEGHFEERIPMVRQDELGQLARSFNAMAEELQGLYSGLEQQVGERTRDLERRSVQLETAARVAREAAAIQDVKQLLGVTAHLISEQFGFYHAGIFLADEAGDYAVLQVASSDGGRRMLARGHKLKVGEEGIVGYVAETGKPRIALDVGADAVFFDNADLPNTRSEMALPLKVRGQVIGILDIQSTQEAAFSDEDVAILQTMADQVALAIANARLLEDSQRALQELEAIYGRRTREVWRERATRQVAAYRYTGVGVEPALPPPALKMETSSRHPRPAVLQDGDGLRLIAPIRLREQNIGSIILRRDPKHASWSPEELALVEEISTQIALAVENAHLLEETQRRAEREQMLGQMTTRFTRSLDMDTLLQTAVRELGQLLDVAEVSVHVLPPEEPLLADRPEKAERA